MPAEITTGEFCASYYGLYTVSGSKPGTSYEVTLNGTAGPHCTCPAFKFSRDHDCKHLAFVHKQACLWNCQWHDGNDEVTIRPVEFDWYNEIPGERCPNCDGPVIAVRIAV
jgi:hypothetical protein